MLLSQKPEGGQPPTAVSWQDDCLAGGGEMGALMRSFDWSATRLGPVRAWPQSLKTAVSICLNSRFPIVLWWGPDLILLYNDAWRPVLGRTKHPQALGSPGRLVWPEIWHIIGPMHESVLATGLATWSDDQLLVLDRNGYSEEAYFTYSYSPIRDEGGKVGGVFAAVSETTRRVIGERRLRTLRDLGALIEAASPEEACVLAARVLADNISDIPFSLFYLVKEGGAQACLSAWTGLAPNTAASPQVVSLDPAATPGGWPLAQVCREGYRHVVRDLQRRFPPLPSGPWHEGPREAVLLPFMAAGRAAPAGILAAGVSSALALDDEYLDFYSLVAGHIGTAVTKAQAFQEEKRRAEALAELNRAKTTFFSNVSHEFRTPLTLMLGPIEEALHSGSRSLADGDLEIVHRNSLRLLKLVNSLLDFSRMEAGRMRAAYSPTDLSTLTAGLASVFRSAVERAGMNLIVDCPPLSQPVYVDREMWEKVVLNLLSNAFKFTERGEIEVSLREAEGRAVLTVRDTGVGIAADQLPHIFERFHRVEGARARTHEGTGIGLALVTELVKLHGGDVEVESTPGRGAAFTVGIPLGTAHLPAEHIREDALSGVPPLAASPFVEEALRWLPDEGASIDADSDHLAQSAPSVAPAAVSPPQGRILLADDNADMRDYVARILRRQFDVEAVPDGESALIAIRRRRPDLALADVMMPRLDGFGLLAALRGDESLRSLPVILLSARAGEEARVQGLEAGADDYLVKPFSSRELLASVRAHIAMARLRAETAEQLAAINVRLRRAMRETHHRVKNNLQVVAAMVDMQVMDAEESVGVGELHRLGTHIRALAAIHDVLTGEGHRDPYLEVMSATDGLERVIAMLQAMSPNRQFLCRLEPVDVPLRHGASLAILVNELVMNAGKYGGGRVEISLSATHGRATLEVCDDGPGFPDGFNPEQAANTGLELVQNVARWDLSGEVHYENRPEGGASVIVTFPLPGPNSQEFALLDAPDH